MTLTDTKIDELRTYVNGAAGPIARPSPEAPNLSDDPPSKKPDMSRPEMPAYFLAAVAVVGIVILTLASKAVPDVLNLVTIGSIGIGGAITSPRIPKP